jgi:hypothetical protein
MSIIGCDISGWQPGNVDLTGMGFVYVKSTQGMYKVNANHDAQVAEARSLGLVVGHYHFPAWGDPVAEARTFFGSLGWRTGEFLVLDIENSKVTPWPADPVSWCVAFEREVLRLSELYCLDYLGPASRARWNWAGLAALGGGLISPEYNPIGPSSPAPWTTVAMWQNADTNITGGDSDIFYGDRNALISYGTPGQVNPQSGTVTPIQEDPLAIFNNIDDFKNAVISVVQPMHDVDREWVKDRVGEVPAAVLAHPVTHFDPTSGKADGQTTDLATIAGYRDFQDNTTRTDVADVAARVTDAVSAALPRLVADAVAAHPPAVDVNAIADAVLARIKAQYDK